MSFVGFVLSLIKSLLFETNEIIDKGMSVSLKKPVGSEVREM